MTKTVFPIAAFYSLAGAKSCGKMPNKKQKAEGNRFLLTKWGIPIFTPFLIYVLDRILLVLGILCC